jgi:diguanylate cyclase (GGDEF)-like protein
VKGGSWVGRRRIARIAGRRLGGRTVVVDDAGTGRRAKARAAVVRGYTLASITLIGLYPILPGLWRGVYLLAGSVAAAACVGYGRRAVPLDARQPWTLLIWALVLIAAGDLVRLLPNQPAVAAGWLLDAAGNVLVLGAALAMVIRRGASDLGGLIDAAVIAVAAGSILWVVLPHRIGDDQSFPAQVNLFVVVFALTGVLGALLRLAYTGTGRPRALWLLLFAITLAIAGNSALAVGGGDGAMRLLATMLFLASFTAIGLFGLDPTGPRLAQPQLGRSERLSAARLVFLCIAIAITPVALGTHELLTGDVTGAMLAAQGTLVAVLVMARIGTLSAQRNRAEQALQHQATHDPLTHLLNRRQFTARLQDELDRGARCAVLFCDLDNFKVVNDRFGHDAGDALLIEVARRIRDCVVPPHAVSRFGGDEFVVLLVEMTAAQAQATQACIATALRRPFEEAPAADVDVSIGRADADGERDPEQLISSADRAMYRVKTSRRSERQASADRDRLPNGVVRSRTKS